MDACPTDDRLRLMLDGELPPAELAAVEAHIARCIPCRDTLERWTSVGGLVRQIVAVATLGVEDAETGLPSVPGFRLRRVLGRGGHGIVYLAWNEAAGRDVALKVLRAGWAATDAERRRFRADATALARLSHPNIVPLYAVGEFAGHPYIEMEFLPGGSLAEPGHAPAVDVRGVVERLSALARAVHYAHTRGIVHRDLKPGNVLLAADGTPKIADFGLARFDDPGAAFTASTAALGTPGYQAPELVAGGRRPGDPRTDVYGLGAVAYHWLAGHPPYQGSTPYDTARMTLDGDPISLRQRRHTVPADVETVVMKCLDVDPGVVTRRPRPSPPTSAGIWRGSRCPPARRASGASSQGRSGDTRGSACSSRCSWRRSSAV